MEMAHGCSPDAPAITHVTTLAQFISRTAGKFPGIKIRHVTDVDGLEDDGAWTHIVMICEGEPVEVLVFETENFYACLRKVMKDALPSTAGSPLN